MRNFTDSVTVYVTVTSEFTHVTDGFPIYRATPPSSLLINQTFSKLMLVAVAVIGLTGNAIAAHVLSSSSTIRKCHCYPLLRNQCLADLLSIVFTVGTYALSGRLPITQLSGFGDWLVCQTVRSGVSVTVANAASSYNLAAMTVERTAGVVWPIAHRARFTRRNVQRAPVVLWAVAVVAVLPHSLPSNGISPNAVCNYWSGMSVAHNRVQAVTFNLVFFVAPLAVMVTSYALMYDRLVRRKDGGGKDAGGGKPKIKVKMNVIRVLGTCVLLYLVFHVPHFVVDMASRLTDAHWVREPWYTISVVCLGANTVVNPLVYAVQYRDYKREAQRQMKLVFCCARFKVHAADNSGEGESSSATVPVGSSKLHSAAFARKNRTHEPTRVTSMVN